MAIASSELVEREIRIEAPPSVVFEFLTDPAKMVRWMGTEAVLEPWPGGRYYVNLNGHEVASGEVLEIIPERRLVFSWGWADGSLPLRPGESTVEISLEPDGDGTRLRLTHRDLPSDMRAWHGRGWDYALPRLAVVAAGRDPGPDPLRSILRGTLMAARSLPPRYLYRLGRQRLRDPAVLALRRDDRRHRRTHAGHRRSAERHRTRERAGCADAGQHLPRYGAGHHPVRVGM